MKTFMGIALFGLFCELSGVSFLVIGSILTVSNCSICTDKNFFTFLIVFGTVTCALGLMSFFYSRIIYKRKIILDRASQRNSVEYKYPEKSPKLFFDNVNGRSSLSVTTLPYYVEYTSTAPNLEKIDIMIINPQFVNIQI